VYYKEKWEFHMTKCGRLLDELQKKGSEWKIANAAANSIRSTDQKRAALNRIEKEFIALRDGARVAVRSSGTLEERNRWAVLQTPRATRTA
jgi:hypothetical protein